MTNPRRKLPVRRQGGRKCLNPDGTPMSRSATVFFPDDVFEALARRVGTGGKNRSEFIREAVEKALGLRKGSGA